MENITSKFYKTIGTYLRHKTYHRLTIRPRQSIKIMGNGRRLWRVKSAQPTIKLQSEVNSKATLLTRIKRSSVTDVLVFLSGGEGGLVSGPRTGKKCVDDRVCDRQSPISHQVSLSGYEFKRKTMLNVHIPELLPLRRSYTEGRGFTGLRAVNSFRISAAAWPLWSCLLDTYFSFYFLVLKFIMARILHKLLEDFFFALLPLYFVNSKVEGNCKGRRTAVVNSLSVNINLIALRKRNLSSVLLLFKLILILNYVIFYAWLVAC
jgi:hypothetical protein